MYILSKLTAIKESIPAIRECKEIFIYQCCSIRWPSGKHGEWSNKNRVMGRCTGVSISYGCIWECKGPRTVLAQEVRQASPDSSSPLPAGGSSAPEGRDRGEPWSNLRSHSSESVAHGHGQVVVHPSSLCFCTYGWVLRLLFPFRMRNKKKSCICLHNSMFFVLELNFLGTSDELPCQMLNMRLYILNTLWPFSSGDPVLVKWIFSRYELN